VEDLPLRGLTVGVTATRQRDELVGLLERRGARVVEAPAIRILPTGDDDELLATTRACLAAAPDGRGHDGHRVPRLDGGRGRVGPG